jgi:hypothetical protein
MQASGVPTDGAELDEWWHEKNNPLVEVDDEWVYVAPKVIPGINEAITPARRFTALEMEMFGRINRKLEADGWTCRCNAGAAFAGTWEIDRSFENEINVDYYTMLPLGRGSWFFLSHGEDYMDVHDYSWQFWECSYVEFSMRACGHWIEHLEKDGDNIVIRDENGEVWQTWVRKTDRSVE